MVPDDTALVPALGCLNCGRLIPRTGITYARKRKASDRAELNRVKRAARRMKARADARNDSQPDANFGSRERL